MGEQKSRLARFETTYQPGRLTAIAYRSGAETGRTTLTTAGRDLQLAVAADRNQLRADDTDLAYVTIELQDIDGKLATHGDRPVEVHVTGAGLLAGLGSGRTSTEERFDASTCTTFDGRALATIRPTSAGTIQIEVAADDCTTTTVVLEVEAASR